MTEDKHKEYMQEAIRQAGLNVENGHGGPFGAVIVRNGTIIAATANKVTSSNDPTAHAEIVAIREACKTLGTFDLSGCEIYASCEPCPMCLGAVMWARLDKLYFAASREDAADAGFDDELFYREFSLPIEKRSLPSFHLPHEGALEVFQKWNSAVNKIEY